MEQAPLALAMRIVIGEWGDTGWSAGSVGHERSFYLAVCVGDVELVTGLYIIVGLMG